MAPTEFKTHRVVPMVPPTLEVEIQVPERSFVTAIQDELESLARQIGEVRGLVVGDRSGLPIASTLRGKTSLTTTAMATLALTAATKITTSLSLPGPEDILIEAGEWHVLVRLLGNGFTLTGVFPADENIGLVKIAMQARGREIRQLLDEMA
jgi:predicted regulator of Ras-like GTPase activity (Roadblock/LC7/MglB family)